MYVQVSDHLFEQSLTFPYPLHKHVFQFQRRFQRILFRAMLDQLT